MQTAKHRPQFRTASAKTLTREVRCPHGFLRSVVPCPDGCPLPDESRPQAEARLAVEWARAEHTSRWWMLAFRRLRVRCPELTSHEREVLLQHAAGESYRDV